MEFENVFLSFAIKDINWLFGKVEYVYALMAAQHLRVDRGKHPIVAANLRRQSDPLLYAAQDCINLHFHGQHWFLFRSGNRMFLYGLVGVKSHGDCQYEQNEIRRLPLWQLQMLRFHSFVNCEQDFENSCQWQDLGNMENVAEGM